MTDPPHVFVTIFSDGAGEISVSVHATLTSARVSAGHVLLEQSQAWSEDHGLERQLLASYVTSGKYEKAYELWRNLIDRQLSYAHLRIEERAVRSYDTLHPVAAVEPGRGCDV